MEKTSQPGSTCWRHSTSTRALSILSCCRVLLKVSFRMSPKSLKYYIERRVKRTKEIEYVLWVLFLRRVLELLFNRFNFNWKWGCILMYSLKCWLHTYKHSYKSHELYFSQLSLKYNIDLYHPEGYTVILMYVFFCKPCNIYSWYHPVILQKYLHVILEDFCCHAHLQHPVDDELTEGCQKYPTPVEVLQLAHITDWRGGGNWREEENKRRNTSKGNIV